MKSFHIILKNSHLLFIYGTKGNLRGNVQNSNGKLYFLSMFYGFVFNEFPRACYHVNYNNKLRNEIRCLEYCFLICKNMTTVWIILYCVTMIKLNFIYCRRFINWKQIQRLSLARTNYLIYHCEWLVKFLKNESVRESYFKNIVIYLNSKRYYP